MSQIVFGISFDVVCCGECKIYFAIASDLILDLKRSHDWFYCPKGHRQHWPAKSDVEVEREKANAAQAKANEAEHLRLVAEKKLRDMEVANKRLKRRITNGVCPCCTRTFKNLAEHMKSDHPAQVVGNERKKIAAA